MPINLFGLRANVAIAKETATFAEIGVDSTNMVVIYEVGNVIKSYKPNRTINPINGIEADKGYYIVPKVDLDLTQYFAATIGDITTQGLSAYELWINEGNEGSIQDFLDSLQGFKPVATKDDIDLTDLTVRLIPVISDASTPDDDGNPQTTLYFHNGIEPKQIFLI
ncbi:MAG TPA: hypothetical protein VD794_02905 [Flavisolibacter sp.]|nr:hypothetical protein [Flavisolibacter sp.]